MAGLALLPPEKGPAYYENEITAQERARIAECTDLAQLKAWVTRAATVPSTSDLFR